MKKKLIALLLVVCMVAAMMPTVFAADDPYLINNLSDLKAFRDAVNGGDSYSGKTVKLTADIDLAGEEWTPIGSSSTSFNGIFDGDNHKISNLVVNGGSGSNLGFFGVTQNGEIKNLTFENAKVSGRLNVAVVAGTPYTSKYTNITVTGHVEVNGMAYVGGVGGKDAYADWTDITVNVDDTSYVNAVSTEGGNRYRTYVGGVVGFNGEGGHTFKNITSNIDVIGDVCDVGGIFGIAHYSNKFENIKCSGDVTNTNSVEPLDETQTGGICGVWHNESGTSVTFADCEFTGTVTINGEVIVSNNLTGGAYNPGNDEDENSGSLVVDGNKVWPLVAEVGGESYGSLQAAFDAAEDGDTIKILCNIVIDDKSCFNLNGYNEGAYYEGDESFTIDLNGMKITNTSAVNDYLLLFKNNGTKANEITIKNGTIEAASSAYCAVCTSGGSTQQITVNLEDVNVIGSNSNGSVIKVRGGTVLNVKAGTVITGKNSYLAVEGWASTVNIYDGAEIYQKGTTSYNGCLVGVGGDGVANVYGGYGEGIKGCFIAMTSGGIINVSGGEWIADTDGSNVAGNDSVLIAQNDKATYPGCGNSVINVTGGKLTGSYNCYGNAVGDAQLVLSGGAFSQNPAAYIPVGYVAPQSTVDNYYYVEVASGVEMVAQINDGVQYQTLAAAMAALKNGDTLKLLKDLELSETLIIDNGISFTLDGNGHKIIGNGATTAAVQLGNTTYTADAAETPVYGLKNIIFDGWTTAHVVRVQSVSAVIEGCTFQNCNQASGLALLSLTRSNAAVKDCVFRNNTCPEVIDINSWGDGSEVDVTIEGCEFTNNNCTAVGVIYYHDGGSCEVNDCEFTGNTCALSPVFIGMAGDNASVSDCIFTGNTGAMAKAIFVEGICEISGVDESVLIAVAKIGDVYYGSLEAAIEAAQTNDTVTLLADVKLAAPMTIGKSITIDGNGKTLSQADSCNNQLALLYFNGEGVLDITIKNLTFDGIKTGAAIRTLSVNMTIDNCVFRNSEHTQIQGLVRLTQGKARITNSTFIDNTCQLAISFNYDAGLEGDTLLIDNCQFKGNTASTTALIYYVEGAGCTITNSKFVDNKVNCNNNGALIYLGFQKNCVVTGNLFKNNKVTDASSSTRVAGAVFAGKQATITNNAFDGNTASNANGDALGQVCISTYYEDGLIDLSDNYWGGDAPAYGKDYTVQHQTGDGAYKLDSYYNSYSIDRNGKLVLEGEAVLITYEAKIDTLFYETLEEAIEAAEEGSVVTLLQDLELTETVDATGLTIDLNGHTISAAEGYTLFVEGSVYRVEKVYSITYVVGDGTISDPVTEYTYSVGAVLPKRVSRAGFAFEGWYDNASCMGQKITRISATERGDKVFYAKWSRSGASAVPEGQTPAVTPDAPCSGDVTCPTHAFADLNAALWYHDGIHFVLENGLMNGTGDNTFEPDTATSRAMIVTILWRLEGKPVVNDAMRFADVASGTWYTEAVRWAASTGIVEGYNAAAFGPNDTITREQLATIMWRYAKYKGIDVSVGENTNILSYGDAFEISKWAIPALQWACGSGLVQGIGTVASMNLVPEGSASRAQTATILYRFCEIANQ